MRILEFIEKNFWLFFLAGVLLGLFFPAGGNFLNPFMVPLLMVVLFLTCVKIDMIEVIEHVKNPLFIVYVLAVYLIVVPLITYYLFYFINQELAVSFLLLTAIPPGVASPFLTDLLKGNVSLSLVIAVIGSLIAPFTMTVLLFFTVNKVVQIDLIGILQTLLPIVFVPFIVSQILRKTSIKFVQNNKKYFTSISTILLSVFLYIAISKQASEILKDPLSLWPYIFWLYVLFILMHVTGYFFAFWRNKKDKIALTVTKIYLNNALAIVIAHNYFSPKIALIILLSELPWTTLPGLFRHALKFVK